MTSETQDREPFDAGFRRWAERLPTTTGAEAASRLFEEGARRRAPRLSPGWVTVASAAVLIVAAVGAVLRTPAPTGGPARVESRLAAPSPDSDVVVLWLDDQTPVHVFLTEASARGGR